MEDYLNNCALLQLVIDNRNIEEMKEILFESDSSSSDSEKEEVVSTKRRRITNYVSNVVASYSIDDFKSHFRMSRGQFECLLRIVSTSWEIKTRGRPKCTCEKALLTTVWYLANSESYRQIGDRFDFERGQAQKTILGTCKMLYDRRKEFIKWPEGDLLQKIVEDFNILRGSNSFPNVVSCIDGTHIIITGSLTDNSYYNRHGQHSIQLQASCDSRMIFTDVYVGWPGSVHDARVWRNSPLCVKLTEENPLPPDMHMLGDSAYPITNFLMTPYRDDGHLSVEKKIFNRKLSSTRVVIEQAFGRLKGIFRRLKYLEIRKLENAKYIIMAAYILHNYLLQNQDSNNLIDDFEIDFAQEEENTYPEELSEDSNRRAGNVKREYLTQLLSQN